MMSPLLAFATISFIIAVLYFDAIVFAT